MHNWFSLFLAFGLHHPSPLSNTFIYSQSFLLCYLQTKKKKKKSRIHIKNFTFKEIFIFPILIFQNFPNDILNVFPTILDVKITILEPKMPIWMSFFASLKTNLQND